MSTTRLGLTAEAFTSLHGTMDAVMGVLEWGGVRAGLAFGTLLGAVRTGDFLPWDSDADLLVKREDWPAVRVALATMQASGYSVWTGENQASVRAEPRNAQVDVFCADPRPDGRWEVPGWPPFMWSGAWECLPLRGLPYVVPESPRRWLRCVYGAGWMVPFADYWSALYARDVVPTAPSAFAVEVAAKFEQDGVASVLDLGCGNGRDAVYFAGRGLQVHACDPMQEAVEAAGRVAAKAGIATVNWHVVDVLDDVPSAVPQVDAAYLRFVLHAVQRVAAERIVPAVAKRLRPGGMMAVEVRSTPGHALAVPLCDGGYLVDGHYRRPMAMGELYGVMAHAGLADIAIAPAQSVCGDDVADTWRAFAKRP